MDLDLYIKIDSDLFQIHLKSAHRYPTPIEIHFKSAQIQSNLIWIRWILSQIRSIVIPTKINWFHFFCTTFYCQFFSRKQFYIFLLVLLIAKYFLQKHINFIFLLLYDYMIYIFFLLICNCSKSIISTKLYKIMKPLNKSSKLLTWSYRQNCQILKRKKKKKTYQSNIFNFEPFKSNLKKPKHYQTFRKYIKTQQQINERNQVRRYWETISVKKHSWRHCALVYNFYCKASIASWI